MGRVVLTTLPSQEINTVLPAFAEEMALKRGGALTSHKELLEFARKEELELGLFLQRRQVF